MNPRNEKLVIMCFKIFTSLLFKEYNINMSKIGKLKRIKNDLFHGCFVVSKSIGKHIVAAGYRKRLNLRDKFYFYGDLNCENKKDIQKYYQFTNCHVTT